MRQRIHDTLDYVVYLVCLPPQYDGYASCPLLTAKDKCIMAEFNWDGEPQETFPINQARERALMYHLKTDVMPSLYWHFLVKYVVYRLKTDVIPSLYWHFLVKCVAALHTLQTVEATFRI